MSIDEKIKMPRWKMILLGVGLVTVLNTITTAYAAVTRLDSNNNVEYPMPILNTYPEIESLIGMSIDKYIQNTIDNYAEEAKQKSKLDYLTSFNSAEFITSNLNAEANMQGTLVTTEYPRVETMIGNFSAADLSDEKVGFGQSDMAPPLPSPIFMLSMLAAGVAVNVARYRLEKKERDLINS